MKTSSTSQNSAQLFNKICVVGSGKGRLEFLNHKFPFDYESELNKSQNEFVLVFDFPLVGEKKAILSLDPRVTAKKISQSRMLKMISSQIEERSDKDVIMNSVEEFFVLTSEFIQYRAKEKLPDVYQTNFMNDHYFIMREHSRYRFEIDSYALSENYFERVVIKIFSKDYVQNGPVLNLFLVPESCEK